MNGKTEWFIGDGFMSNTQKGDYVSHETVCVLNMTSKKATEKLTIYFEDHEPMKGFIAV